MNRDDIIRITHQAGLHLATDVKWMPIIGLEYAEKLIQLAAAEEREACAQWMIQRSYATGHGDTMEDLLKELEWQIRESEREACAKVCDKYDDERYANAADLCANAIRARNKT